ncbi:Rho guanine nucleotide exchange factor, putative [Hondaea fermentalgiana]|uniref:Rho guanine nucleotide exchange factor, putative n=1 Tax=Hondaea fermentalgiana TaxID=2315210 RepID=A0A2R5GIM5_9STRA|nr:Rho guanine nucleotide exchange factor, putative [Hondaea fermentalgiana]|eukprot:GBG28141.1 Rho guanine nucleotide exchange factor, putative [Hondaea fermentalgiana]
MSAYRPRGARGGRGMAEEGEEGEAAAARRARRGLHAPDEEAGTARAGTGGRARRRDAGRSRSKSKSRRSKSRSGSRSRSRSRSKGASEREKSRQMQPLQLGQLVQIVPVALLFLRDAHGQGAGDLFLDADESDRAVQHLLVDLMDCINMEGDLTMAQYRELFGEHEPATIASAVRVVMLECEPRFVPREVGEELVQSLTTLDNCVTGRDCARMLGPALDKLPRAHYMALAELCAFLRDTGSDAAELACLIGPALFSDGRASVAEDHAAAAAAAIMDLLIEECGAFFGRVCAVSSCRGLGDRQNVSPVSMAQQNALSNALRTEGRTRSAAEEASLTAARMKQLVTFYNWRDPAKAARVPLLFENHEFLNIAHAIHLRYPEGLPRPWRAELMEMKARGIEGAEWFDPSPPKPGAGVLLPPPPPPRSPGSSRVDQIVNEIIDTEHAYHEVLVETLAYGKHIRMIARGRHGVEAMQRLGLSAADVDTVFGMRLEDIVDLSERFLAGLEVIDLVRTPPRHELGRPGLMADAMSAIIDDLHVYAPYVSMHRAGDKIIKGALARVTRRATGAKRLQQGLVGGEATRFRGSFAEIWENMSTSSARLCGQSLESALIAPVQRVPRYKLLFDELAKRLPGSHPAYERVNELAQNVADVADQLNQAMRQHEKIAMILGDDIPVAKASPRRTLFRAGSSSQATISSDGGRS